MNKPKQVILVRTDVGMKPGKIASQVAHASLKVFFDNSNVEELECPRADWYSTLSVRMTESMTAWKQGEFTKVILEVESEDQLLAFYSRALLAGLPCAIIQDNGHTVFDGVKTYTTMAIGPAYSDEIDKITGDLKLLK